MQRLKNWVFGLRCVCTFTPENTKPYTICNYLQPSTHTHQTHTKSTAIIAKLKLSRKTKAKRETKLPSFLQLLHSRPCVVQWKTLNYGTIVKTSVNQISTLTKILPEQRIFLAHQAASTVAVTTGLLLPCFSVLIVSVCSMQ